MGNRRETCTAEPLCGLSTEIYGRVLYMLDCGAGSVKFTLDAHCLLYIVSYMAASIAQVSEGVK